MLDTKQRELILYLCDQGHGPRAIARTLHISRGAVRRVLANKSSTIPVLPREQKAEPYLDDIRELVLSCRGNLVRVHEELTARGATLSYQALTGFCRRQGIGHKPQEPSGRYTFAPGKEMQHDTSPHKLLIAGKQEHADLASLVMCYSRKFFMQYYPAAFNRFDCKVFLTDALCYFGGAAEDCMIDNTHVVVHHGSGKTMVPAPEMEAFADRYGFTFRAHERGDANRSARVEGHFDFAENNFLAGRTFSSWQDLNAQLRAWCDKKNAIYSTHLHASRNELFAAERLVLKPLPIHVPDVYLIHNRIVDLEGCVSVHRVRYSAPYQLMGRRLEVRETKDAIDIYDGPRRVALHEKLIGGHEVRVINQAHRPPHGEGKKAKAAHPVEEAELLRLAPELATYATTLRKQRSLVALRGLLRLLNEYPRDTVLNAVATAAAYGLYDIPRLERMILRAIAKDYFNLPPK